MINEEGKRLKLFIDREGKTQKDFAASIPITQAKLSRYINGQIKVPLDFVKKLHLKYSLNYAWFFHGVGTLKYKAVDKRNIMTDITDMQASLGVIMANQDAMRDTINQLARELYAAKHKV